MAKARKRTRRRKKMPTVWQHLNEPVVELSEDFGQGVFFITIALMMLVWLTPYFGSLEQAQAYHLDPNRGGVVAGATIEAGETDSEFYKFVSSSSTAVTIAFSESVYEVLDISEPVKEIVDYYKPGVDAVWNAWLELMMDPDFSNY